MKGLENLLSSPDLPVVNKTPTITEQLCKLRNADGPLMVFIIGYCNGSASLSPNISQPPLHGDDIDWLSWGRSLYSFVTPFVMAIGIVGNIISLCVFMTRRMRKMSASLYLASLALSDTCVIVFYVLVEWLNQGLPQWPGKYSINFSNDHQLLCSSQVFIQYIFRFTSAWIIVAFTVERYIGICRPLDRRVFGPQRRTFALRSLIGVALLAILVSAYKPFMMEPQALGKTNRMICSRMHTYQLPSFVLDAVYGFLITIVPFVIMLGLNLVICRRLRSAKRRSIRLQRVVPEDSKLRLEFTGVLLIVSSTFIVLNVPFFVAWCYNYVQQLIKLDFNAAAEASTETERSRGWVYITRTIFYGNYCVNFFIYSLSGAYFRHQLLRNMTCCDCRPCREVRAVDLGTVAAYAEGQDRAGSIVRHRGGGTSAGTGEGADFRRTNSHASEELCQIICDGNGKGCRKKYYNSNAV